MRVASLGLLAWFALQTALHVPVWRDTVSLWTHAAHWAPRKPRVISSYGSALLVEGRIAEGLEQYRRAYLLLRALHVPPGDAAVTQRTLERNVLAMVRGGVIR